MAELEPDNQLKSAEETTEEDVKTTTTSSSDCQKQSEEKDSDGTSSQKSSSSSSSRRNKRKAQQPIKQTTGVLTTEVKKPKVTKSNSSDRPYVCTTCLKSFTRSHHLTRHEYSHTGERPFMCGTCGKTFIRKHKLTVHIRSHTGEKPYLCSVCSKGFSSSEKRKLHERIHSGIKPYPCESCDKSFKSSSQLKKHTNVHKKQELANSEGFGCNICYKLFVSEYHLANHKAKHNKKKKGETGEIEGSSESTPQKTPKKRTPKPKKDASLLKQDVKKGDLKIKVKLNAQNTAESSVVNISNIKSETESPVKKQAPALPVLEPNIYATPVKEETVSPIVKNPKTPDNSNPVKFSHVQPVYRKFYEEVSISASEAAKSAASVVQKLPAISTLDTQRKSDSKPVVSKYEYASPIPVTEIPTLPLPSQDFLENYAAPSSRSLTQQYVSTQPSIQNHGYNSALENKQFTSNRSVITTQQNINPNPRQFLGSEYSLSRQSQSQFVAIPPSNTSENSPYKQYPANNMTNPTYINEVTVQTSRQYSMPYSAYPSSYENSPSVNNGSASCMYTTTGQNGHTTTHTNSNVGANRHDYQFSRFGSLN